MVARPLAVAAALAGLLALAGAAGATYHLEAPDGDGSTADAAVPPSTATDVDLARTAGHIPEEAPGGGGGYDDGSGYQDGDDGSGSPGSGDGDRGESPAGSAVAEAVADHVDPEPVPDAARRSDDLGAEAGSAHVEVLTEERCQRGRLMGVTVLYAPGAVAPVPEALPWGEDVREGSWYWGVHNPWDAAVECLTPGPAPSVDGPSPARVAGAGAAPSTAAHQVPDAGPDGTSSAPGADEGQGSDAGPEGTSGEVNTAAYRSPPSGDVVQRAVTLVLAALSVPAAVALYRRLTRDELLENETRAAIYELVLDEPGLTAAEASERLDVHYRTARHHLEKLAEFGKIVGKRIQGRIRYFENHQRYGLIQKRLISCMESETKREVIMEIARSGAVASGDLAHRVDVAPSTASHHLGDLEDEDLVAARREGRSVLYRLEDGVLPALMDLAPLEGDEDVHTG